VQKILINGLQLGNLNTGVQYYTQQLYKELKIIETDDLVFDLMRSPVSRIRFSNNNRLRRIIFENIILPPYLYKSNYSLYHSPNYVLPYLLNSPSVLTIHDLITLDYPKLCQIESSIYFRLLLSRSIKKATRIIAVSKKVKDDILRHFTVPDEKIDVIYHGINQIFKKTKNISILDKYHLPNRYFLFVGNIEPKKNLERLIRAFDLFRKTTKLKHKLIIVGKKGWKYKPVFKTVAELSLNNEIIFTGYVPEEDLPAIYSMADLFVFPSLYEGFGIPPLEAMSCEIPVIVSNKGALPEITGGNCIQVNPYDINNIAESMHTLITDEDLRSRYVEQGKSWVNKFTWNKTACKTIKVYKKALNIKESN
jgi:glycosyltransferase involved in cell wall biosynthesis